MSKEMVISANPHETRVAILEEGQLCEYYVEREKEFALVGSIYKGRVTRVLPGMQSAFVEIGLDSDAFLYVTDFLEGIEEFDEHVATTAEEKIQKMEEQGGQIFPASAAAPALEPADVESAPAPFSAPPEEFASDRVMPSAPVAPPPPPPALNTSSPDRPQFENRSPRPDRGGRDFGRRGGGGRRGGRFGRRDNRGGRGGSGGGDHRYGRELPPSKYASPRPHEDQSSEPALPADYVPIILPGESLAKYKEKPPSAAPPASFEENVPTAEAHVAAPEPAAEIQTPPAPSFPESVVEAPRPALRISSRIPSVGFRPRAASRRVDLEVEARGTRGRSERGANRCARGSRRNRIEPRRTGRRGTRGRVSRDNLRNSSRDHQLRGTRSRARGCSGLDR